MTANGLLQIALYFAALLLLVKPLGGYMARVYMGKPVGLERVLGPAERLLYRIFGTRPEQEMSWQRYLAALLLFNAAGMLLLYMLQRLQAVLPLNPRGFGAVAPDLALNTAVSFTTNTNWQSYGGETTMSYLTQMLGMNVQNFLSAASGMAVLVALIRGIARHSAGTIGNFWVDLTRSTLYILLPLALLVALLIAQQGVVQSFADYRAVNLLEPQRYQQPRLGAAGQPITDASGAPAADSLLVTQQTLPLGPAASQIAIKHLGTNGGGFFNANAAHPFENPTPLSDFVLVLAETCIAAALTYTFGVMVGDTRQGWAILAAMLIVLAAAMLGAYWAEAAGNPRMAALGADTLASAVSPGGSMEGKELRFGIARSALFATATTATSSGAVNAMHDSLTPLGGLVALVMMQLSETILGGVGSGLYGMLVFVIVAVFIAGLMVGRTPEYLGKKIEAYEIKMASLIALLMPLVVLGCTAIALVTQAGTSPILNTQPAAHGLSEVLYAFSSLGNNNGSAFAGLGSNTLFYNLLGALAMLVARYWLAIPTLAIAGSLARKKLVPAGSGTLPTHTPLFITLLIGVVMIVGALTFIPALALGPIVEHLMMIQ